MTEIKENNDEISLRDLIVKIRSWFYFLLSKWFILLLAGIFGGAIGLIISIYTKPKYTGTLTFVLYSESKCVNLSGLASQFELDLGSGGVVMYFQMIISLRF